MAEKRRLISNWAFHYGECEGAEFMGFDDRAWRRVTVPHDWAVEFPFDTKWASGTGYLPGGVGWYRKAFTLSEADVRGRVRITFSGVYKHAKVWINSNFLGNHAYGYTSFGWDITAFVRPGENVIAVRVEHNDVADSRWYTGSGIDRDVFLEISDSVCFRPWGVFPSTMGCGENSARIRVKWKTFGAEGARFTLKDGERILGTAKGEGESGETMMDVSSPPLWSPDSPKMLTLAAEALSGGAVRDTVRVPFAIRSFLFDPD